MKKILCVVISSIIALQCISPSIPTHAMEKSNDVCNDCVATIDFSRFNKNVQEDELMSTVKQTLLNANKYALGGWFKDLKHLDQDNGKFYNLYKASGNSSTPEYVYRFPAAQAFGIAISLKTGAYDEAVIGVAPEEAKAKAIKLAVSVAHEHKANTGVTTETQYKPWGDDWQAAHWAYYAGYAAWLLWDNLTEEEQKLVRNMLIHEANRFVNQNALYWKTASGKEIYKGDSKIEEDSWNSELLNLTYHMLPQHENADKWKYRMIEYQLASFAPPEMNTSDEIVHGKKAKDWVKGYNINSDGTVINHDRVHPQYNSASTGVNTSIVNSLAGDTLPLAAKYNLDTLYSGLTDVKFDAPPYRAPGGTMYIDDSYEIYYPEVSDWGYGVYDTFANIDVSAYVYGYDDNAYEWAKLHAKKVLEQQSRYTDGHTYANGESLYPGREEAITMRMGNSYMTLWLKEQVGVEFSNDPVEYPHEELPQLAENQQRIFASESGYVRDGANGDTCYYPSDVMEVKKDGPGYARESYLKFNLDDLNALPEKAEIYLPVVAVGDKVETGNVINKVELLQEDDWSEDTLTYNKRPVSTGIVLASWTPNKEGLKFDVSKYIRDAYSSDKKLSIKIYSDTLLGGNSFTNYGSSRQADPNYQPQLIVSYNNVKADLQLIGNVKTDVFDTLAFNLEGYQLQNTDDDAILLEYDADKLDFLSFTSENDQLKVSSVDHTVRGKVVIGIKDAVIDRDKINIAKILFQPIAPGNAVVKASLLQKGNTVVSAEKNIEITKAELQNGFVSCTKPDHQELSTADTTVRVNNAAGNNGTRVEVDVKTYGNNVNTRQAFFKFPLPTKDEIETIDSLSLNFYVDRVGDGGTDVRFQYINEQWDENTLEWNNKPGSTKDLDGTAATIPAADADTLYEKLITNPGSISFDITAKAKELVAAGESEMSVFVYSTKEQNKSIVLRTKEHPEEATRPYINAKYKKNDDVLLNSEITEANINRLEDASINVSVKNISDVNDAELDVTFSDHLDYKGIEALRDDIHVEVIGVIDHTVRVRVTEITKAADTDIDLFTITFKTIASGSANVTVTAKDEDGNIISSTTDFEILPLNDINIDMQVTGDEKVNPDTHPMTSVAFDSLVPGVRYQLDVDYDSAYLDIAAINSKHQNIIVNKILNNGNSVSCEFEVLPSSDPYILNFTWDVIKGFTNEQNISFTLHDEAVECNRVHTYVFDEDAEITEVDKTELIQLYESLKNLQKGSYTNQSWNELQNAMAQAKIVMDKVDATQEEVDQALTRLKNAKYRLQIQIPSNPDETEKPTKPTNPVNPSVETGITNHGGVNTGDSTNVMVMIVNVLLGLFAVYLTIQSGKDEQENYPLSL